MKTNWKRVADILSVASWVHLFTTYSMLNGASVPVTAWSVIHLVIIPMIAFVYILWRLCNE